ncbi:hypothetical protein POKO110462_02920 [Pontibacter korlensis]
MLLKQESKVPKKLYRQLMRLSVAALGIMFSLGHTPHAWAQNGALESIAKDFDQHRKKALQEKLFLHVDRPAYICGETMWFKLYNVDGTLHKPLDMSKVAYVEVLDASQKPVLQAKIALKEGVGSGSFILPATLVSGNYSVRAYTNWMKNFSPDLYFEQAVTIVNTLQKLPVQEVPKGAALTAQFFPEGGNMVAGVANKVGFQVVDQATGEGVAFKGEVHDREGNKVAEFEPHKFGIGHFIFTPAKGGEYTAIIKLADNRSLVKKLPSAYEQGYALQLEDTGAAQLQITVNQAGVQGEQLYLLGHTRQMIAIADVAVVSQGRAVFLVDKKLLADGIIHFTVFNANKQPVCERLYFKRPTQTLQLNVAADKAGYNSREKVTLDLLAEAGVGKAASANLSLAVFKLDSLQKNTGSSIESYIWLTSDLKGTIESPSYYFSAEGAADREAMDNLMLTHGWSRFKWEDVLGKEPASYKFLPEYDGHQIRGRVTSSATSKPTEGVVTYLASPSKLIRLYNSTSNADGFISFDMKDFFGDRDIVLQSNYTKDSTYHFEVFSPFSDKYGQKSQLPFNLSEELEHELTLRHVQAQVQQAYFSSYSNRIKPANVDSLAFYGKPDEQYFLDDYKRFKVMEEVMREYVPGVQVRKQGGKFRFMVFNRPYRSIFNNNPMVLLDGVPVFDIDKIMAFDPLKVKKLDVISSRFFNGPLIYEGLVSYTTYKGDLAGFELNPKALFQAYEGLQLEKEFYAPSYETTEQRQSRLADFRNLLHWEPNLSLEAGKGNKLNFYTSDQAGTYLVVVQGVSGDGLVGSKVHSFTVKQPRVLE